MPVADLPASMKFFSDLGFTFKEKFTGEDSACLILGPEMFAMLSKVERFGQLTKTPVTKRGSNEFVISLGCESKEEVSRISEAAFAHGARRITEPEDSGFMFSWGFEDLDGHLWDLFWMDPEQ